MSLISALSAIYLALSAALTPHQPHSYTLPDSTAAAEVRVLFPGKNPAAMTLALDNGLILEFMSTRDFSDYTANSHSVTLQLKCGDNELARAEYPLDYHPNMALTIGLDYSEPQQASVYIGDKELTAVATCAVPPMPAPRLMDVEAKSAVKLLHVVALKDATPMRAVVDIPAVLPTDRRCARWTYFDRTNNPDKARPGGEYVLLTLPDPDCDGAYLLVYVSGATTLPELWQPGTVKGRLTPTVFQNHYNLTWTTADPTVILSRDCQASFNDDLTILTLSFPLEEATLRLSRQH